MPYINIRETDITPVLNFDSINNAVLIFGFDFRWYMFDPTRDSEGNIIDTAWSPVKKSVYGNKEYKIYTSLQDFLRDFTAIGGLKLYKDKLGDTFSNEIVYRPYLTAYDCLLRGLPVIYVPIDDYIDPNLNITYYQYIQDSEQQIIDKKIIGRYIEYSWLSGEFPNTGNMDGTSYQGGANIKGATWLQDDWDDLIAQFANQDLKHAAEKTLYTALEDFVEYPWKCPIADRINMPVTFITTCGWEGFVDKVNTYRGLILKATGDRLDLVYLYDIGTQLDDGTQITPEWITTDPIIVGTGNNVFEFTKPEIVNIVYPWGHYNLYGGKNNVHMPGSYGWLMAYATSIRNNNPWMATAGVYRGVIPNIVALDYDITEAYIHKWQGDPVGDPWTNSHIRINPIVDFGRNYGKMIFGNRTCFPEDTDTMVFRTFLNVRLLLVQIHKQLFRVSMTHMFEPNDDIVWLSFKQAANVLLDKMVSGRGIKWYKWQRIRPEDEQGNLILGQIRAKLTIRPLETVESFDITINMTDQEIEVVEGEE